ncbi:MAG: hypothetical protein M3253_08610, partial [Chloroflexota bacterium]|nr:hypothetical protein [Chloroflexota bacterium]
MPEHDFDERFERRLEERLRDYAEQGVRPFDAVQIALRAAGRVPSRGFRLPGGRLVPAPVMWLLLAAVMVVAMTATAVAAGWIQLPALVVDPRPSPTPVVASPSPTSPPTPVESPTAEPTLTPVPTLVSTPGPTAPIDSPGASPSP